ncbi:MAG: hypothetical protein FWD50_07655 [Betaproteobacteria bacterium]|nr:hypothetical protein [Betaproteobacteria bacterium]
MTSLDSIHAGAQVIKRELDHSSLAFKTYPVAHIFDAVKGKGGEGTHCSAEQVEIAFWQAGLLLFPWDKTGGKEGHTRVYRAGSLIASILNAMRFPGANSDEDLSKLIATTKARTKREK